MDAILQINLIYFSPHHNNKFVNSVNSLKNSLAALAETKKANMLDFTRSVMPNVSQSKLKYRFLWSDNCSLFTDYTHLMNLSLNMLIHTTNSIKIYHIQCTVGYLVLSVLSKCWVRTLVPWKHFCPKSRLCD